MKTPTDITNPSTGAMRLRVLLITDFVSSTQLIETLGDRRAAKVFARHDRLARDILEKFKGIEIDKTDGFLFLFSRPSDAVSFALHYHTALVDLSKEMETELKARIGIHLGEVILRRNRADDVARGAKPVEVEGLTKHAAARLASAALGGQTLMTEPPYHTARRAGVGGDGYPEDIEWVCHGEYMLKGIDEPTTIFEVGRKGLAPLTAPPDTEKVWRVGGGEDSTSKSNGATGFIGAMMGVVLAAAALAGMTLLNKSTEEPVYEAPAEPISVEVSVEEEASVETPDEPIKLLMHLESHPSGATFHANDTLVGTAPTTWDIAAEPATHTVVATLEGYQEQTLSCVVTQADVDRGSDVCTAELKRKKTTSKKATSPAKTTTPTGYKANPFDDN